MTVQQLQIRLQVLQDKKMTTENNELELRIQDKGEGAVNAEGRPEDAFNDPTGQFPRGEYHDQPSVNKVIRGDDVNELDLRNGIPGVDTDLSLIHI